MAGYAKKRQYKLQDPLIFTGEREGLPFVEWLAKIKRKIEMDNDIINTP